MNQPINNQQQPQVQQPQAQAQPQMANGGGMQQPQMENQQQQDTSSVDAGTTDSGGEQVMENGGQVGDSGLKLNWGLVFTFFK